MRSRKSFLTQLMEGHLKWISMQAPGMRLDRVSPAGDICRKLFLLSDSLSKVPDLVSQRSPRYLGCHRRGKAAQQACLACEGRPTDPGPMRPPNDGPRPAIHRHNGEKFMHATCMRCSCPNLRDKHHGIDVIVVYRDHQCSSNNSMQERIP